MPGTKWKGQIRVSEPPTESDHVVRKLELDTPDDGSFYVRGFNQWIPLAMDQILIGGLNSSTFTTTGLMFGGLDSSFFD
jgi:hypothetical protein